MASGNRTLWIVLGLVGVGGLCLVGSCLVLGALGLASGESSETTAVGPPAAATGPVVPAPNADGHPYQCMATATVRICRGPNNCMSHYATGSGVGDTAEESKAMAMTACRGQVTAMGGSEPCTVTCSAKK